jgi:hypothetical protein
MVRSCSSCYYRDCLPDACSCQCHDELTVWRYDCCEDSDALFTLEPGPVLRRVETLEIINGLL